MANVFNVVFQNSYNTCLYNSQTQLHCLLTASLSPSSCVTCWTAVCLHFWILFWGGPSSCCGLEGLLSETYLSSRVFSERLPRNEPRTLSNPGTAPWASLGLEPNPQSSSSWPRPLDSRRSSGRIPSVWAVLLAAVGAPPSRACLYGHHLVGASQALLVAPPWLSWSCQSRGCSTSSSQQFSPSRPP